MKKLSRLILISSLTFSASLFPAELSGVVTLTKPVGKRSVIQMQADAICVKQHGGKKVFSEDVVISDKGTVANVFIYLKSGVKPSNGGVEKTEPIVLDQRGCQYIPHVWGVRVQQPFTILNSDPTLHNVHSLAKLNPNFNVGMSAQGQKIEKKFTKPEVMVRIKCDVHGWMYTYVGVMDHPYFAVTDLSGKFLLKNVPPGEYQLAAWHEKLGEKIESIIVTPTEAARKIDFSF